MPTVKILEHGQVTIPKKIRDIFGIKAGDMADVDIEGDRIVFIPKKNRKEKALEKFEALLDSVHQQNKDKDITEAEVTRDVMQAVEEVGGAPAMTQPIQQKQFPPTQTMAQPEELRIFHLFADAGFIDEIPEKGNLPLPDFTPLPAKGKPASEIIIEERGER